METKNKLWVGLGVVVVAGAAFYATNNSDLETTGMDHEMPVADEGGEGGEGATSADAIASDAVYLSQLAFIRGHLNVGVSLYREGFSEGSVTHMKHPQDEIYANLLPAIHARNANGFAYELAELAASIEDGSSTAEVDAAYKNVIAAIANAENAVVDLNAKTLGSVIVEVVRTSAAEFDIAVDDNGNLEAEHEYQDSLGFVRIANELLDQLRGMTENAEAIAAIEAQLLALEPVWTGVRAPQKLETDPSVIYGAAGRIEFAVNSL